MKTHKLIIFGLSLVVTGTYHKGVWGTYNTFPEPDDFEIDKISIEGKVDVTEMFNSAYDEDQTYLVDRVEQEIINKYYVN